MVSGASGAKAEQFTGSVTIIVEPLLKPCGQPVASSQEVIVAKLGLLAKVLDAKVPKLPSKAALVSGLLAKLKPLPMLGKQSQLQGTFSPPIAVTLSGIVTLVRALSAKAAPPIVVTLSGMVTLVRTFLLKAPYPMVVTLSGMVTLVRALL